ncbi:MAG: hypothetical protein AAFY02_09525 [Pseudomonadota bacterium]
MSKRYTLRIEAYTPETIPMARLAEYIQGFAALLGSRTGVHFDALKSGSTELVAKVDQNEQQQVAARLGLVAHPDAKPELRKAAAELKRLLEEDTASGYIYEDDEQSKRVVDFLGATTAKHSTYGPISQQGSLDGVLISVGGADQSVHIQLQNGDEKYTGIETDRRTARELAAHFDQPIRIFGTGRWLRGQEGQWILRRFRLQSFYALEPGELQDAVRELRAVEGSEWVAMDDPIAALRALRDEDAGLH